MAVANWEIQPQILGSREANCIYDLRQNFSACAYDSALTYQVSKTCRRFSGSPLVDSVPIPWTKTYRNDSDKNRCERVEPTGAAGKIK